MLLPPTTDRTTDYYSPQRTACTHKYGIKPESCRQIFVIQYLASPSSPPPRMVQTLHTQDLATMMLSLAQAIAAVVGRCNNVQFHKPIQPPTNQLNLFCRFCNAARRNAISGVMMSGKIYIAPPSLQR